MPRLIRLLPLTALALVFTAACGDTKTQDPPQPMAGAGGEDAGSGGDGGGGRAGESAGGSETEGGKGGEPGEGGAPVGGSESVGGESGGGGEGPDPVDCSKVVTAPAEVEILSGFTTSEDFAFDELGNYVGVDDQNNLVRISKEGKKTLWAPSIGGTAGMAILPDGSAVINDVGNGAVKRVYPNGASEIVIGGLLYPNGLDVGPDGFIYVAENNAGRVRRVNPDTGEFTIAAMGVYGANGVAVSDDPGLMYVGSFEGSGIYKVVIPSPGEVGVASVFARPNGSDLPEPEIACPDQEVGKPCNVVSPGHEPGICQKLSNVVDCVPAGPCDGKQDGDECSTGFGMPGKCQSGSCIPEGCSGNCCGPVGIAGSSSTGGSSSVGGGTSFGGDDGGGCCEGPGCGAGGFGPGPSNPCDGKNAGDACTNPPFVEQGKCFDYGEGQLYCDAPGPCDGLKAGDACTTEWEAPGVCKDYGVGPMYCEVPNPCEGLMDGDACTDPQFGAGKCHAVGGDTIFCEPVNPCEGKPDGEACTYWGQAGTCENEYCEPDPCAGAKPGDQCWSSDSGSGVCVGPEGGPFECVTPCGGKADGDTCTLGDSQGQCLEEQCALACTTQTLGQACIVEGALGFCVDEGNGPTCIENHGPGGPGGIDGLGVDACGFVYAAEYTTGNLWRISPDGEIEKLADLPSSWIPNIKWGRGLGGFDKEIMYVADRTEGRLFGITVGVPGATEYYDIGAKP